MCYVNRRFFTLSMTSRHPRPLFLSLDDRNLAEAWEFIRQKHSGLCGSRPLTDEQVLAIGVSTMLVHGPSHLRKSIQ